MGNQVVAIHEKVCGTKMEGWLSKTPKKRELPIAVPSSSACQPTAVVDLVDTPGRETTESMTPVQARPSELKKPKVEGPSKGKKVSKCLKSIVALVSTGDKELEAVLSEKLSQLGAKVSLMCF